MRPRQHRRRWCLTKWSWSSCGNTKEQAETLPICSPRSASHADARAGESQRSRGDVEGGLRTADALGVVAELLETLRIRQQRFQLHGECRQVVDLDRSAVFQEVIAVAAFLA